MRNLFDDAAEALRRAQARDMWFGDRESQLSAPPGPEVMARRLAGLLEITGEQVTVHRDPTRPRLGPLALVFEVLAEKPGSPNNRGAQPLRLAPVPGHESEAFFLRGTCRDCRATDAAVAVITCLADLGFYLRQGRGPRSACSELIAHDTGHGALCIWRRRASHARLDLDRDTADHPGQPNDPAEAGPEALAEPDPARSAGPKGAEQ